MSEIEQDTQSATSSKKDANVSPPPKMVFLPNSRRNKILPPPIKLHDQEEEKQGMNPNNMWQVHSILNTQVCRLFSWTLLVYEVEDGFTLFDPQLISQTEL